MNAGKLRIAWWVLCAVAALVLSAMWARSYWWIDSLDSVKGFSMGPPFRLASVAGRTTVEFGMESEDDEPIVLEYHCGPIDPAVRYLGVWRVLFRINRDNGQWLISVPYWLWLLFVAAFTAVIPRLGVRFKLRTLLIAMAIVAVLLWAVMSAIRR